MDVQKIATYTTAAAVVGTGGIVGGGNILDQQSGGPQKRAKAEATELRQIIREEVRAAFIEAWPNNTGPIKGAVNPTDYKNQIPKTAK